MSSPKDPLSSPPSWFPDNSHEVYWAPGCNWSGPLGVKINTSSLPSYYTGKDFQIWCDCKKTAKKVRKYAKKHNKGYVETFPTTIPTPEIGWLLRQYVVNYFLCPDCKCELELEALTRQVFPDYIKHTPTPEVAPKINPGTDLVKVRWRIGKFIIGTRAK